MYTKEFQEAKLIVLIKPMFKRFNEQDGGDNNVLLTQARDMAKDITELLSNDEDEDYARSDSSDDVQLLDNSDSSDDEGKI